MQLPVKKGAQTWDILLRIHSSEGNQLLCFWWGLYKDFAIITGHCFLQAKNRDSSHTTVNKNCSGTKNAEICKPRKCADHTVCKSANKKPSHIFWFVTRTTCTVYIFVSEEVVSFDRNRLDFYSINHDFNIYMYIIRAVSQFVLGPAKPFKSQKWFTGQRRLKVITLHLHSTGARHNHLDSYSIEHLLYEIRHCSTRAKI